MLQVIRIYAVILVTLTSLASGNECELTVSVIDAGTRQAIPARLYLQAESGEWHYFDSASPRGSAVRYEKQNWINKRSVEYHTTVSAHPSSTSLPAGDYKLTVESGKSYFPYEVDIAIARDETSTIAVELTRWNNPAQRGWYSGDTHLHREVNELKNVIAAEELNVAMPLTNWVTISDQAPSAGDKNLTDIPNGLVRVDDQHVIWPRNTEYEIFTVGKHRHTLGALFVLGHRRGLQLGVPPWKPVVESVLASDPNAMFDMDKLDWPFAMLLPTIAPNALYELANNHVWRTEFAYRQWNTPAPAYMHPPFGSHEGGHRQWLNYTMGMYYTLLNCGLRLPPSAGTANGVHPVPAGFGRVYVHLPDGFQFETWMSGLKQGRSFVTTGPMLYATANKHDPGHVFAFESPTKLRLNMQVLSERPLSYGEILVNGRPEILLRPQNEKSEAGAYSSNIDSEVTVRRSGWVALRFWEPRPDGQSRFAHSAPWHVDIAGEPVRPAEQEKRYLIERIENEMQRSKQVVPPAAMQEYERSLAFFRSLPVASVEAEIRANARSLSSALMEDWLDNMILHHRFTADEVQLATGLPVEIAQQEIAARASEPRPTGVRLLPYPGGRHPRIGFLDGAVNPQRETKVSIFSPWEDGGYVVVDVPEAIFSNLGLTYLAHTHIPTIWDEDLAQLEWQKTQTGYRLNRTLPNGICFTSTVTPTESGADMKLTLTNGTNEELTGLRVQVCTILKGAIGFNAQEELQRITSAPFVAIKAEDSPLNANNRWIITAWQPNHRVWTNPPVPCVHSDPIFPDCKPGESVTVRGGLWFYEGHSVQQELSRLRINSNDL